MASGHSFVHQILRKARLYAMANCYPSDIKLEGGQGGGTRWRCVCHFEKLSVSVSFSKNSFSVCVGLTAKTLLQPKFKH